LDTFSAATGQGVASGLQYVQERIKRQELLPEEIEDAEKEIISRAQLEAFPEEYMALLTGKGDSKEEFTEQAMSLVGRSRCAVMWWLTSIR